MSIQIWTREELTAQIKVCKDELKKCLSAQSYTIGTRSLQRQKISDLKAALSFYTGELEALERGGHGPVRVQCRFPRGWHR